MEGVVCKKEYCEQVIIDETQLSHYYNILRTTIYYVLQLPTKLKTSFILINNEKAFHLRILSHNNIKLRMKGDQAYTCNLQPRVMIFSDRISP